MAIQTSLLEPCEGCGGAKNAVRVVLVDENCDPASGSSTPSPAVTATETIICAAGVQAVRRTEVTDGVAVTTFYSEDGAIISAPVAYTIGACAVVDPVIAPRSIEGGIQRQTGAGNISIPVGFRSVAVTVISGNPTVTIGANPSVALIPGTSFSWTVDDSGEALSEPYVFAGAIGDDFYVTSTKE